MKRTKVLHVFGIMNRGGAEMRTLSLMSSLKEKGVDFEFCVLSGQKGVLDASIREKGGEVHYCKLGFGFISQYMRLLRAEKYDVVHSHVSLVSGVMLLLAKWCHVKQRIAHFRNTTDTASSSMLRRLRDRVLKKLILNNATHVLGVCNGALEGYWHGLWQQDPRFSVVYNGFNVPVNTPDPTFWQEHIDNYDGGQVIVNVARMDYQKNHLRQLHIFRHFMKRNPTAWMVFIGKESPTVKAQMVSYAAAEGIERRVVFLGEQSNVLPFVGQSSVMLFPSMWEGLPGAVIEAASLGVPVLASVIPGVEEIASQLSVVEPFELEKSDEAWADKLQGLVDNKPSYEEAIEQFNKSEFLLTANVEKLYGFYTK